MENQIFTNAALIRANQCKKSYYLDLHYPELKDEVSENHQSILERRKIFAKLTNHLFPNGKYAGIDVTGSCETSYVLTKELLSSNIKTIFNACFKHGEYFCFVDVLHRDLDKWNAFEIWDKNDPGNHIILTGTYQHYVMQRNGVKVGNYYSIVYNATKNNEGVIDLNYDIVSIKNQANDLQQSLENRLEEIRKIAKQNSIPEVNQGKHCTTPVKCDFFNYCSFSENN